MTSFDEPALSTVQFQPLSWYRKVDDIFTTIAHHNDPDHLLQHLNAQYPRIQFTMETETDHQLPFLDVSLQSTDHGSKTSVYRKPTHIDQYTHYNSCDHPQIKQAIVTTLNRCAKSICHPDALNHELQRLKDTFTSLNGYPPLPCLTPGYCHYPVQP
ncbi:uncharacterized protein [Haliotis asinina]|uniref:uncharacterized protein n=1 Tax=Haliotis asinina TaxID=109174 RepID=UPI0035325628